MHRMAFVKGYLLLLYFSPLSQNRTPTVVVASEILRFSSISPRRLHIEVVGNAARNTGSIQ